MQQLGWLALSAQISYTVTLEQQTVVQQHNDETCNASNSAPTMLRDLGVGQFST